MAYKKSKESLVVANAKKRLAGMKAIDAAQAAPVEYGDAQKNPCNVLLLESMVVSYDAIQAQLNIKLSEVDDLTNQEAVLQKQIQSIYTRALKGAISKFGEDAIEIEQLGGVRKSERKKPKTKSIYNTP